MTHRDQSMAMFHKLSEMLPLRMPCLIDVVLMVFVWGWMKEECQKNPEPHRKESECH